MLQALHLILMLRGYTLFCGEIVAHRSIAKHALPLVSSIVLVDAVVSPSRLSVCPSVCLSVCSPCSPTESYLCTVC